MSMQARYFPVKTIWMEARNRQTHIVGLGVRLPHLLSLNASFERLVEYSLKEYSIPLACCSIMVDRTVSGTISVNLNVTCLIKVFWSGSITTVGKEGAKILLRALVYSDGKDKLVNVSLIERCLHEALNRGVCNAKL